MKSSKNFRTLKTVLGTSGLGLFLAVELTGCSDKELLEMINQRGLKPVMIMSVKQESFEPYNVPYTTMGEFEEDKRIFGLTLLNTEYMLLTDAEERQCIRNGYLPE